MTKGLQTGAAASPKLQRAEGVVARAMGDRAVLIHLATNRIFELNATGLRVWTMLEHGADRDEISERLQRDLNVPPADVSEAVDSLLADLRRESLIHG